MTTVALDLAQANESSLPENSPSIRRLPVIQEPVLVPVPEEPEHHGQTKTKDTTRTRPRARTQSIKRLSKRQLMRDAELYPHVPIAAPKTRAQCTPESRDCPHCGNDVVMRLSSAQTISCPDCGNDVVYVSMPGQEYGEWVRPQDAPSDKVDPGGISHCRPCLRVSCKFHLYLDINEQTGSIKNNFPDLEPHELEHSCALDMADTGGMTLEDVGEVTNLTRERVRQLETRSIAKVRGLAAIDRLSDAHTAMGKLQDIAGYDPNYPRRVHVDREQLRGVDAEGSEEELPYDTSWNGSYDRSEAPEPSRFRSGGPTVSASESLWDGTYGGSEDGDFA